MIMTMISYKDSIEYLKSLNHQIGQSQHRDLWHFEQAIDEIIKLLKPLAKPHSRLIDAEELIEFITNGLNRKENPMGFDAIEILTEIEYAPTIIEAEVE